MLCFNLDIGNLWSGTKTSQPINFVNKNFLEHCLINFNVISIPGFVLELYDLHLSYRVLEKKWIPAALSHTAFKTQQEQNNGNIQWSKDTERLISYYHCYFKITLGTLLFKLQLSSIVLFIILERFGEMFLFLFLYISFPFLCNCDEFELQIW